MASTILTVKLLIDSKREKVFFAEASKEVIDFLFNLFHLPLSTVIRLLNKNGMVGSLGNLYQSVENMSETYMQPDQCKNALLKPRSPISSQQISTLPPTNDDCANDNLDASFYICPSRCGYNVTCDN
ncbi:tyrosine/DOPA decarboxylase [Spatholobus suberectus]|nr:tyrosine/DOPA decarboxylase [Spatholobus suberectus]